MLGKDPAFAKSIRTVYATIAQLSSKKCAGVGAPWLCLARRGWAMQYHSGNIQGNCTMPSWSAPARNRSKLSPLLTRFSPLTANWKFRSA